MADRLVGPIVLLQVQAASLKSTGRYDLGPLVAVGRAVIGPGGMVGRHAGEWIIDAHHVDHPQRRGNARRALSVGFTSHYAAMAERFPAGKVRRGVAGENVIVESGRVVSEGDMAGGLIIVTAKGARVELETPTPAAPCAEFTSFLMARDDVADRAEILDELAFLDGGTRGFVAAVEHLDRAIAVATGDRVFLRG